jgi:seryl-tRNA synthetase
VGVLDIKRIREEPEVVKATLSRRDPGLAQAIDAILDLDRQWRAATSRAEELRAAQKARSEEIAQAKRGGEDAAQALAAMKELSAQVKELIEQARLAQEELLRALAPLPNLPDPSAAPGPEDELVREVGAIGVGAPGDAGGACFEPRDHLELAGERIDMDHAAKLSGARFAYLKGDLVLLELALVRWVLEKLRRHGFEPVIPPVLVRERALFGTGFLPDTEQQIYHLPGDDLYLVGTSEVALASLHDEEIIEAERLPLRYAGFSPCFRREAGAAGKDTRGIFRVHQFDKVEMFSFVAPEESGAEHERILGIEEEILGELGLPYRVVNIAVGDLGNSAAKKYDCEVWLPSQGRYRELTSCSDTTDYQARRLNIRLRREKGTETLHTLNGTAVAVGRTLIALLENGQRGDGSVGLPECLGAYGGPGELAAAPLARAREDAARGRTRKLGERELRELADVDER